MRGVHKYCIIKPLKLILQFHQNDLTFDGLKNLKLSILNDKSYDPNFNFIIDLRLTNVKMSLNELKLYGDWVQETLNDSNKNMSILTETPNQVSNAIMFKLNDNIKNLHYEVFCSMEAALNHVDVDLSNLKFVEDEIRKLKE